MPAVVLFSVIAGRRAHRLERKQVLLDVLQVGRRDALARATRFVVRLTPYGLFAIAATAAGTLSVEQLGRLQVYLVAYIAIALLVSLWVLPGLVAALTPIPVGEIFALDARRADHGVRRGRSLHRAAGADRASKDADRPSRHRRA